MPNLPLTRQGVLDLDAIDRAKGVRKPLPVRARSCTERGDVHEWVPTARTRTVSGRGGEVVFRENFCGGCGATEWVQIAYEADT